MSLASGILSYWKLDVNTTGTRVDEQGNTDLVPQFTGVAATTIANGKINIASESTATDYLVAASGTAFTFGDAPFTISMWINADTWSAASAVQRDILTKWISTDREFIIWWLASADRIQILARNSDNAGNTVLVADNFGAVAAKTAQWIHIAVWHDPVVNQLGVRINGGTPDTIAFTGGIQTTNQAAILSLSSRSSNSILLNSAKFDGRTDELGIWDRVLASGEIDDLYNAGEGLSYDLFNPQAPSAPSGLVSNAVSSTKIFLSWLDLSTNEDNFIIERSTVGPNSGFAFIASGIASSTTYQDISLTASTPYYYRVKARNTIGDSVYTNVSSGTTQENPPADPVLTYRLAAHWSMEEAGATSIRQDDTANNIDLTPRNADTPQGIGLIGSGSVNANQNGLVVSNATDLSFGSSNFTIAGWFNAVGWNDGSSTQRLLATKFNTTGKEYEIDWVSSTNRIRFLVNSTSEENKVIEANNFGAVSARINEWIFISAWHDAENQEIGIQINDGAPDTVPYSSGVLSGTSTVFGAGTRDGGGFSSLNDFSGRIDGLGLWTRVLSSGDLVTLYASGSGLAYPFSGGGGSPGPGPGPGPVSSGLSSLFLFF